MPGVKKYTLLRLHEALQLYTEKTGRRPTYEYAMIEGVNDTNPEINQGWVSNQWENVGY